MLAEYRTMVEKWLQCGFAGPIADLHLPLAAMKPPGRAGQRPPRYDLAFFDH
jgi:hypothetical protein